MARASSSDPLDKFRFKAYWSAGDDPTGSDAPLSRAGFHDVTSPSRTTTKTPYREGIDPPIKKQHPGLSEMEDVVLSRGLTSDDSFYEWAKDVHEPNEVSSDDYFRKTLFIEVFGKDGKAVLRYILQEAFPVGFKPGADLNASEDGEKSLEQLTITYDDFTVEYADSDGNFV